MTEKRLKKEDKKTVTISLQVQVIEKLDELSKKFGMTKSGLISFLINKTEAEGTIFN